MKKKHKKISDIDIKNFIKYFQETGSILKARKLANIGQETALKIYNENNLSKNKFCIYCGSKDLYTLKNGKTYPCCKNCKDIHFNKIAEKRKETTKEIYKVDNVSQSFLIKEKRKETNKKIYGVEFPIQNPNIYSKIENTWMEREGVRNVFQTEDFKKNLKIQNLEQYGVEYTVQRKEIRDKISGSHLNISNEEKTNRNNKRKQTYIKNTGYEYNSQIPEIKEKVKNTFKTKHGGTCSFNSPDIRKKIDINKRIEYWNKFCSLITKKEIEPLFTKDYYIDTSNTIFNYKCKVCKKEFETKEITAQRIWCGCRKNTSKYEDEIEEWLKSIGITGIVKNNTKHGNRKLEIDIDIPDKKIGIDFHGLLWHSDSYHDKKYHQDKYLYFNSLGIDFIQIFENEWKQKKPIVQSIIKNKLGINTKIYARKCELREISYNESKEFLELNHLQGNTVSKVNIGLFYKDELIAVITFGKNRYKKEDAWELLRFCSKIDYTIIGGFSKALKYFEKKYKPNKLISFIDVRYFNGKGYKQNNFKKEYLTNPNYFYFLNTTETYLTLYSRIFFQKHKLKDKLKNFDPELSEYENLLDNNYLRIYDAGNLKMIKLY